MIGSERISFSPSQAAAVTSLSLRQITRAVASGELPSFKIGRRRVITRAALENYVSGVNRSDITKP
jgi:excisionase family DNA binding protein